MAEHVQRMDKARSGAKPYGHACIIQNRLPQTTSILQISSVLWTKVFHDFDNAPGEWTAFDVGMGSLFFRSHWH